MLDLSSFQEAKVIALNIRHSYPFPVFSVFEPLDLLISLLASHINHC